MCFFTSLAANAAAVAKKYGKQLDIVEAARQILAEQEQEQRAKQEADPKHKISGDKTIDTSEDGDKKSISTEFRIKNSSGYSMSYVKCEDGKVVAIKWVVEE